MQIRQMESFGRTMSDVQYQRMEQMAGYSKYFAAGAQVVTLPLMALVIAGIAFAVFNAALGGDATFKQVYAIVAHSGVIIAVQQLFTLPLDYVRETMSSPTNLAVFLAVSRRELVPGAAAGLDRSCSSSGGRSASRSALGSCIASGPVQSRPPCSSST